MSDVSAVLSALRRVRVELEVGARRGQQRGVGGAGAGAPEGVAAEGVCMFCAPRFDLVARLGALRRQATDELHNAEQAESRLLEALR